MPLAMPALARQSLLLSVIVLLLVAIDGSTGSSSTSSSVTSHRYRHGLAFVPPSAASSTRVLSSPRAVCVSEKITIPRGERALTLPLALRTVVPEPFEIEELTPIQIKMIRKEIQKRRASKQLTTVYWTTEENADNTSVSLDTARLQDIANLVREHHLVQVRGISLQQISNVKALSERLARDVEMEMTVVKVVTPESNPENESNALEGDDASPSKPRIDVTPAKVFVVEIVGHAATLYSPPSVVAKTSTSASVATPTSNSWLQLRTTGKSNAWNKRLKAPRDNRGQIIR